MGRLTKPQTKEVHLPCGVSVVLKRPSVLSLFRAFGSLPLHSAEEPGQSQEGSDFDRTFKFILEHVVSPKIVDKAPDECVDGEWSADELMAEDFKSISEALSEFSQFGEQGAAVRPSSPTDES